LKRKKHPDKQLDIDKIKEAYEQPPEHKKSTVEETIPRSFSRPSTLDLILTSSRETVFASGHEIFSSPSKFAFEFEKKRKPKKDLPKVPWPGEETILIKDKRTRNVRSK
jgi:hypothetical protein